MNRSRQFLGLGMCPTARDANLVKVAARVPKAIVSLLSALRVHEIGTRALVEVWIAIAQHMVTPRLDQPAIHVVRMSDEALADGVEHHGIDDIDAPLFGASRTVVDCFRFLNKIGLDVALEALREGWSQRKFTLDDLWRHATLGRVTNAMRPYVKAVCLFAFPTFRTRFKMLESRLGDGARWDMTSQELLRQIEAAEQALGTASSRSKSAGHNAPAAEIAELRDAVALASMKLIRLRGLWEREFGRRWPETSEY